MKEPKFQKIQKKYHFILKPKASLVIVGYLETKIREGYEKRARERLQFFSFASQLGH